jgi:DNA-binding transcriptional MerR regulator
MAASSGHLAVRSYSMGDVSRLLEVRPHTVRYWEKAVPFLSARRSAFGRRAFTARDVSLLYRLRHLVRDARFTLEAASERLWLELSDDEQDARARIGAIRAELLAARSRMLRREAPTQRPPAGTAPAAHGQRNRPDGGD